MEYANLGKSGLKVSRLCLGTMTFGEADESSMMHKVSCDEQTAGAIMDKALDAGVNFWDTADVYGQDGLSERVIGNWFERTGRRDQVVLATKFRFAMGEGPNNSGAARVRIVRCVEESLKRLKTDRIDLYQVHLQDNATPEEETLRALDDLVSAGKVLYTGCSNYAAYRLMESVHISDKRGYAQYASLQPHYNLLTRGIERELVPVCVRNGIGIIPWSPLAGGLLTGKYERGKERPEGTRMAEKDMWWNTYQREQTWDVVEAVKAIATEVGSTPAQVALAWCLHKPGVTSVIFGARTIEQLDDNLAAAEVKLPDEAMKKLDEVSAFDLGYPYDFMSMVQGSWW